MKSIQSFKVSNKTLTLIEFIGIWSLREQYSHNEYLLETKKQQLTQLIQINVAYKKLIKRNFKARQQRINSKIYSIPFSLVCYDSKSHIEIIEGEKDDEVGIYIT